MHWILQDNLFNESAYQFLVDTLQRLDIPFSIHKVIPFIGELVPEPEIGHTNVMCMGAYSLRHAAKKYGWTPGVFDLEPTDFTVQKLHWAQHMLNYSSIVCTFEEAAQHQEYWDYKGCLFIRPTADSKVFAGKIFDKEDFFDWHKKVVVLEEDYGNSLTKNTLIQLAIPVVIYSEYRFWVVKGQIVCASLYKRGDRVMYSSEVDECYFDYVRDRIAEWQPHEAFVIDVCDTEYGLRIVEINTLNSSGFYACDIPKLVMALEEGFSK